MSESAHIHYLGDLRALNEAIGAFSGELKDIEEKITIIFSVLVERNEERLAIAGRDLGSSEDELHHAKEALNDCELHRYDDEDDELD